MGFFVISGYCIYLSAERLVEGDSFQLKNYLLARLTRIVPLYYIALLFTGFVEWFIAGDRPQCWRSGLGADVFLCQLLLIQNFTQTYGSYVPSWSITNEVFYYVFYGLIVFAVARFSKWPATIGMAICLLIGIGTQLFYRLGFKSNAILQFGLLFGLGINWFLGSLVAEHRHWLLHNRGIREFARCWPLLLALSIAMWCSQRVHLEFVYTSSGMAFTLMLVRFLASDAQRNDVDEHVMSGHMSLPMILGLASYPTYLFHGPILVLTGAAILHWKLHLDWRLIWALSSSIAILIGVVLGYLAERPIMAWRASLLKRFKSPYRSPVRAAVERPIFGMHQ
jgi:peptidoglycan/LPS O-acetylase OafA/YrhL